MSQESQPVVTTQLSGKLLEGIVTIFLAVAGTGFISNELHVQYINLRIYIKNLPIRVQNMLLEIAPMPY